MRENKFRAWKNGKMIGWQELVKGCVQIGSLSEIYMTNPPKPIAEFMQYAGLKDKNGKEIYEGDILRTFHFKEGRKTHYLYHIVSFDEDKLFWYARNKSNPVGWGITGSPMLVTMVNEGGEIIGNIYENPELLIKD